MNANFKNCSLTVIGDFENIDITYYIKRLYHKFCIKGMCLYIVDKKKIVMEVESEEFIIQQFTQQIMTGSLRGFVFSVELSVSDLCNLDGFRIISKKKTLTHFIKRYFN